MPRLFFALVDETTSCGDRDEGLQVAIENRPYGRRADSRRDRCRGRKSGKDAVMGPDADIDRDWLACLDRLATASRSRALCRSG
jgi:hypothetical protein